MATNIGTLMATIGADTRPLKKGLKDAEKQTKQSTDKMATNWSHYAKSIAKAGVSMLAVSAAYNIGKDLIATGIAAERMAKGLDAAMGSAMKGAEAQRFLREQSERLGLVFEDQARGFQKVAAAAQGTILQGQAIRDVYLGITEASTALQLTSYETEGALLAVSQMISKGTVSAEELRGQLGERLPGAFQIAAKAMNLTTAELGKMMQKGELLAVDFLPKFAKALSARHAGSIASASETAQAEINRLNNAVFDMKKAFMDIGVLDAYTRVVKDMTEVVEDLGYQINLVTGFWSDLLTSEPLVKTFKITTEPTVPLLPGTVPVKKREYKKDREWIEGVEDRNKLWIKKTQEIESFAIRMAESEQARLNEKYELQKEINTKIHNELLSDTDFRLQQLDSQFLAYDGFVKDKAALDGWYIKQHKKITDELKIINKAETQQRINDIHSVTSTMANGFKTISEMGGKHSKEAFAMYKAFKITETIISTYSGAMKAYESLVGIPFVGPALAPAAAAATVAFGLAQVGMIKSAQPPSYDQGGISRAQGIYQTGNIDEAHIPLQSGKVPVSISGRAKEKQTVNIILNNPVFQDVETQRQVMAQIATVVAAQVAPGAVVNNYENDGEVRKMIRGGM